MYFCSVIIAQVIVASSLLSENGGIVASRLNVGNCRKDVKQVTIYVSCVCLPQMKLTLPGLDSILINSAITMAAYRSNSCVIVHSKEFGSIENKRKKYML